MTRSHQKRKEDHPSKEARTTQYMIIAAVVIVVVALLFVKQAQRKSDADAIAVLPSSNAIAEGTTLQPTAEVVVIETLEEKIDRLNQEKQAIFVFFHSDDCHLCIEMMKVVEEVLPEYEGRVNLVDVNVYDEANRNLLIRAQIRAIPTQLFFDTQGVITSSTGLMSAEELRNVLDNLAGE